MAERNVEAAVWVNSLITFSFRGTSLEQQLPKLRIKGYSYQCITHFGCCIKRKARENIQVCVNVLPTSYRQVTDTLPTVGRQSADCRPTGSLYFGQNLSAVCQPTNGRQTANCRLTVGRQTANRFFGELFFTITEKHRSEIKYNVLGKR